MAVVLALATATSHAAGAPWLPPADAGVYVTPAPGPSTLAQDLTVVSRLPTSRDDDAQPRADDPNGTVHVSWRWVGHARFSWSGDVDAESAWQAQATAQERAASTNSGDEVDASTATSTEDETSATAPAESTWIAVNVTTGMQYEVTLPRHFLDEVRTRAAAAGWHRGFPGTVKSAASERALLPLAPGVSAGDSEATPADEGLAPSDKPLTAKGWSDGDDTRTRRFDNTTFPFRAMGQLDGGATSGCSGTLIGPRHVLTAAHCLWNIKSDSWQSSTRFRPGREGTCNNAGCEPYGEYGEQWYFTPAEFPATEDWKYDYGILVTQGTPGNLTGWMGYIAISQDWLQNTCDTVPFGPGFLGGFCYNRGYPACGYTENASLSGNNCQQGWAYEDVNPCEIGSFSSTGPDGWKTRFSTNCDLGRGHSGSAVWTPVYEGDHKVVLGVVSTQSCTTCDDDDHYPNGIRRITPDVLGWISYFKTVAFP